MKVGSDGVLLGAWADASGSCILDVGTGTGLIALMMAQRNGEAVVDAIDIDLKACLQASENVASSPFAGRINVISRPFVDFSRIASKKYDLVISNPPYFKSSLKSPNPMRTMARHDASLTLDDLIRYAGMMLVPGGRVALIIPASRDGELRGIAVGHGMKPIRTMGILNTFNEPPRRILYEFSPDYTGKEMKSTLTLREDGSYTDDYRRLTDDFYLKI